MESFLVFHSRHSWLEVIEIHIWVAHWPNAENRGLTLFSEKRAAAARASFLLAMVMRFFLIVASPARGENRMCSHLRTSDATVEKLAEKNRKKFNELHFCDKIMDLSKFVAKCSHHCALATWRFSKKSHHHRKQKIARVAAALRLNNQL